jgi:hypothetical protein
MRKILLVALFLMISPLMASGATTTAFTPGWDLFNEPLDFKTSSVTSSLNTATKSLTLSVVLMGATPNKLYQIAPHFFAPCATQKATMFGQFPLHPCITITRQGVTADVSYTEVGVVTTDAFGNGGFAVIIGPIASGTYSVEFLIRNGAGCDLIGGANVGSECIPGVFQSPGPKFGDTVSIHVP